jgi:putative ABC transport system permease protein
VTPLATRAGQGALRAGRLRPALTALQLARRPGLDRIFALLVVTVAVTGYAVWGALAVAAERDSQARAQAGAVRVLQVQAANRQSLLAAVRAADPTGRYAMAAARSRSQGGDLVLAVDTQRLAATALWPDSDPLTARQVAALLTPPAPAPVQLVGDALTLTVDAPADPGSPALGATVQAQLVGPDGVPLRVGFGPLRPGRGQYPAGAPSCARAPGCRLAGLAFGVAGPLGLTGNPVPSAGAGAVLLHQLSAGGRVVLGPADFADRTRWRPTVDPASAGLVLASAPDGLAVSSPGTLRTPLVPALYPVDTPLPLPMVTAGAVHGAAGTGEPQLDPFGGDGVPVRAVAAVPRLPALDGSGILVDLAAADRLAVAAGDPASAESLQVWLAPGAPGSVLAGLRAGGVTVLGEQTLAGIRHGLATDATGTASRYRLVGALLALTLAGVAVLLVGAVERPGRAGELRALRCQGLSGAAARAVAWHGYALPGLAALVVGLVVAALARALVGDPLVSGAATAGPGRLALGALVSLAVLGPAVALCGARLAAAVSTGPTQPTATGERA